MGEASKATQLQSVRKRKNDLQDKRNDLLAQVKEIDLAIKLCDAKIARLEPQVKKDEG